MSPTRLFALAVVMLALCGCDDDGGETTTETVTVTETVEVEVTPDLPNLVVRLVDVPQMDAGGEVIVFEVVNAGTAAFAETMVSYVMDVEGWPNSVQMGAESVPALDPGETFRYSITRNNGYVGVHTIAIEVAPEGFYLPVHPVPEEWSRDDNSTTITFDATPVGST